MLLHPSFFAVGRALGVNPQTVQHCVERAVAYGPLAALDDRPRPGKEPTITAEAKAWLVSLACRKAKELGYPHELWTTRLLAGRAREQGLWQEMSVSPNVGASPDHLAATSSVCSLCRRIFSYPPRLSVARGGCFCSPRRSIACGGCL
jgi:hypothetical protein